MQKGIIKQFISKFDGCVNLNIIQKMKESVLISFKKSENVLDITECNKNEV